MITAIEAKEETKKNKLLKLAAPVNKELSEIDELIKSACVNGLNECRYVIPYDHGKEWIRWRRIRDYLEECGYITCLEQKNKKLNNPNDFVLSIHW